MKLIFHTNWLQRTGPTRASSAVISVQDLTYQSQPLFNIKDSNKVACQSIFHIMYTPLHSACSYLIFYFQIQDERERYVARKFKYEDPRPEQIQDLEVCITSIDVVVYF